jgi:hypothetical protein
MYLSRVSQLSVPHPRPQSHVQTLVPCSKGQFLQTFREDEITFDKIEVPIGVAAKVCSQNGSKSEPNKSDTGKTDSVKSKAQRPPQQQLNSGDDIAAELKAAKDKAAFNADLKEKYQKDVEQQESATINQRDKELAAAAADVAARKAQENANKDRIKSAIPQQDTIIPRSWPDWPPGFIDKFYNCEIHFFIVRDNTEVGGSFYDHGFGSSDEMAKLADHCYNIRNSQSVTEETRKNVDVICFKDDTHSR